MDSRYNSQQHEDAIYKLWVDANAFNPDRSVNSSKNKTSPNTVSDTAKRKSFTIMMPPPNANDPLHIGHAIFLTIEDIMIRYHRMLGDETLWLPGTDHAGIETQFVFEKKLKKQKKSRFDFDRQTLYKMIWDYVQENSDTAVNQMKKIGASADWSRFRFMLDPKYVDIVLDTFMRLHKEELIYRDFKLVNYSPAAGTSYSDLEINYIDATSPLYYVKYYINGEKIDISSKNNNLHEDENGQYIVVATTRPEPLFVDTHLAVHPDNPKTTFLLGKQVANPLTNEPMDIIADSFVDPEFGTGIVKLTPAHDHADFEVAQRHNLPIIEAIDTHGRIKQNGGELAGLKVKAAREKAVEILTSKNAIEKIDTAYQNRVATDYKSGQPIEPLPLAQFFVKVKPLTEPILKAIDDNTLTVHGAGHDKILKHWLTNLRDWNISRQIVWGIRIPVWYDVNKNPDLVVTFLDSNKETISDKISNLLSGKNQRQIKYSLEEIAQGLQTLQAPIDAHYEISKTQPGADFIQETDTFDTWFSSAQWPFATLQSLDAQNAADSATKENTTQSDFERFYPTQVMETGYDILPFWVMRMLIVGHFATGKLPFKDVYLHGLVRDQNGKKMSKSKGNVINPLEIIESHGADALRMALVIRSSAGLDKSVGIADFKASRNLTNKMWNAARFVQILGKEAAEKSKNEAQNNSDIDHSKAIAEFESKLQTLVTEVTTQIESYRFGLAAETLYNEFWHWYCDQAIESTKSGDLPYSSLYEGLKVFLKLFHPFMPFVTEAIWQEIVIQDSKEDPLLITAQWPE
jgi:valyl-tRNA synthetase